MSARNGPSSRDPGAPLVSGINTEVLLWQARVRVGVALLGAACAIALLLAKRIASLPRGAALICVVYALFTLWVSEYVRRRRRASPWIIGLMVVADIVAVFGITYLVVPPAYFNRALLLGFAILHLSQLYGRRTLAWSALAAITLSYLAIVARAAGAGAPLSWVQECWSLGIFVLIAGAFVVHGTTLTLRLERIAHLFARAEGGDFSEEYDVAGDARPDSITQVGIAYNRVRMQLANLVLTDPLSGCYNRRGLEQQLAHEISRAARHGSELSLVALDVDRFKTVNDTFGHLAGDAVVQEMGELLREVARTGDIVSRIGGDEFVLLLPETSAAGAFRVATRIKEEVGRREFQGIGGKIQVTVSIGLVTDRVTDENIAHDLHSRADEALYSAKDGGRNRVSMWTENLRVLAVRRAGQQMMLRTPASGRPRLKVEGQ